MSLDNKKLDYFKKDEKNAVKEYEYAAKMACNEVSKRMFMAMAEDEARHAKMIEVIKAKEKEGEDKSKKSRFRRGKSYEDEVKEHFEKEGVYDEQNAEDAVSVKRPSLPEENEWEEEYEDDD